MTAARQNRQEARAIKTFIGWAMMLLGLLSLTGALADSHVGARLRGPGTTTESAPMADIDRVYVRADTGRIEIATADRPDLGVTLSGGTPGAVRVDLARQGSELQVRLTSPWWHSPRFAEPTTVHIWLPEAYHGALAVKAVQSSITVSAASLSALDIDVGTAKVAVRDLNTDRLTYKGRTGAFTAEGVRAGNADLRLTTGKIEVTHFTGAMQTHLTTGSLHAQFDALTGPVTVDQTTGELILDLPDGADFTLKAGVRRGNLTDELRGTSGFRTLTFKNGAGTHPVDLSVGTGMVTIR